jgi:hypothetical protein
VDDVKFIYSWPGQKEILIEFPEIVGFFAIRATGNPARTMIAKKKGSDFKVFDLTSDLVPGWIWQTVAERPNERGLSRIAPGRYQAVIRYIPDIAFSGDQVCVATSSPFEVYRELWMTGQASDLYRSRQSDQPVLSAGTSGRARSGSPGTAAE